MKNLISVLFVFLISYSVSAQEETLLSGKIESGGYGGLLVKVGQINGEVGVFMGGQGGWIINHRFAIGGKGYGLINRVAIGGLQNVKLEFGCWGALLEYIISSNELVHLNIQSMIGAGGVRYAVIDYQDPSSDINHSEDGFFVMEPGIHAVLNVSKKFRIGAGATYRYVSGVDYETLSNDDLSGLSGEVVLKFGRF